MTEQNTAVKAEKQAADAQVAPEAPVVDLGILGTSLASYDPLRDPVAIERATGIGVARQTVEASYALFNAPMAKYDPALDPVVIEREAAKSA